MKNITSIDGKVYEGCGDLGKINGIPYDELTPINPRYILVINNYGTDCTLIEDGEYKKVKRPEGVSIGNAEYALTEEEYTEMFGAKEMVNENIEERTKVALINNETDKEHREHEAKAKEWDDIYNEGGEGYNPYRHPGFGAVWSPPLEPRD